MEKNRIKLLKVMGLKIQMLRKQKEITQKEFAGRLGISRSYMGYIEQGRQYPSLKLLMTIAICLGVRTADLLTN